MSESEPKPDIKKAKQKPGFYMTVKLSSFEAALIYHLRQHEFGDFEVLKQFGEPRKVKKIGSEMLNESEAYKLQAEQLARGEPTDIIFTGEEPPEPNLNHGQKS
jgi:hypothetical protein